MVVDIHEWLEYDFVYTVNPVGKCGGLDIFWKICCEVDIIFDDKNILDVKVIKDRKCSVFYISFIWSSTCIRTPKGLGKTFASRESKKANLDSPKEFQRNSDQGRENRRSEKSDLSFRRSEKK